LELPWLAQRARKRDRALKAVMEELSEEMLIVNPLGMHARPAATLVQTVLQFASDVYLQMDSHRVNAKSIMGLLTLAAAQGSRIKVICKGPDARDAMLAVRSLIASGFGEK
jgi:phosphotransferase system HPr (HPr) family protein